MSAEWPLVKAGLKGRAVSALQRIKAFQSANKLDADGVVGPHTWQLLISEAGSG